LLVEVVFSSLDGKQTFPLHLDFFESMTVSLKDVSCATARLTLFDRTGDFILGLIAASGVNRRILLRWGWDNPQGLNVYPQYVMNYLKFRPEFTPEGTRVELELLAEPAYVQRLDTKGDRTFPAGITVAEAVQQIADERKWKTRTTAANGVQFDTVEPTVGAVLTEELVQRGQSDFEFIRAVLLPRANNSEGSGNYRFYFDHENVMHFRPPDLVVAWDREYTYVQKVDGEVINFSAEDNEFEAAVFGAAEAVYWGIDSLTGQRLRIASSGARGLPDRRVQIEASGAALLRLLPADGIDGVPSADLVNAHKVVLARTAEDFEQKVRARFDHLRQRAYRASLDVLGTHGIGPLGHIKVNVFTSGSQQPHFLGGIYTVSEVEHEVGSNGWQTHFGLYRGGLSKIPAAQVRTGPRRQMVAGFFASEDSERAYEAGRASGKISVPVLPAG
jgi:hypothetical protein